MDTGSQRSPKRLQDSFLIKKGKVKGRTSQMPKNEVCIKVLLWIGMVLFLLWGSLKITDSFHACMEFSS